MPEIPPSEHIPQGRKWGPWISAAASLLCLALLLQTPGTDGDLILRKLVWPLGRLLGVLALSLSLSAIAEGMGWSSAVARTSRPLMRLGRLSDWSGAAFTAAFLSGVAANTLLWNAFQEQKISRRELFLAVLLNLGLPSYTLHLPTTVAIIVPLAGEAGILYVTVTLAAAVLRTACVLALGRLLLPAARGDCGPGPCIQSERQGPGRTETIRKLLKTSLGGRLAGIVTYTVPIFITVVLLQERGFFRWLQEASAGLITGMAFPVEGASVVVFSIVAEFTAGAAAAGAMLHAGVLSVKQTVIALLCGNVIGTPIRALRHQLPRYLGIFQPSTGTQLLVAGQALRVVSILVAGMVFYHVYP